MNTGADGAWRQQRVGDAERAQAIEELNAHWRAGRLDPGEHEARTTRAHAAVTRGDLDALFEDLPVLDRRPDDAMADQSPAPLPRNELFDAKSGGLVPADSFMGQRREAIMALAPFAALVLFFVTKTWLWFLLVPVVGIVLYGGGGGAGRSRHRRRGT